MSIHHEEQSSSQTGFCFCTGPIHKSTLILDGPYLENTQNGHLVYLTKGLSLLVRLFSLVLSLFLSFFVCTSVYLLIVVVEVTVALDHTQ